FRSDLVLRDLPLLAVCAGKRVPGDRLLPEPKDLREAVLDAVGDERRSVVRLAAVEAQGDLVALVQHLVLEALGQLVPVGKLVDGIDRKSTRLNSSHVKISYAV